MGLRHPGRLIGCRSVAAPSQAGRVPVEFHLMIVPEFHDSAEARRRLDLLIEELPEGGMFTGKQWVISPWAMPLGARLIEQLEAMGPALRAFQQACEELYLSGVSEERWRWVTELLDLGKPADLVRWGRHPRWRGVLPGVLRPDFLLAADDRLILTEIDSVPGGIGVTARLAQLHARLGDLILGGERGMLEGFARAFHGHDILISAEAADYAPEMIWLADQLAREGQAKPEVLRAECVAADDLRGRSLYRFVELFDLPNLKDSQQWLAMAGEGVLRLDAAPKAFLEEKLWLALFHSPALTSYWREALSAEHHWRLSEVIPQGWVLDPSPLGEQQQWPGLAVHDLMEIADWGRRQRELVIKISGYSPLAWGARSVSIGHDLSPPQWRSALEGALGHFKQGPFVMQRFHRAALLEHPAMAPDGTTLLSKQVRTRLCPYYFAQAPGATEVKLGGVLATLCPADKKILHGMRDAMLLPCSVAEGQ